MQRKRLPFGSSPGYAKNSISSRPRDRIIPPECMNSVSKPTWRKNGPVAEKSIAGRLAVIWAAN